MPAGRRFFGADEPTDAIAYAHEHRVVHRDLKTANVMVTPAGRIKVLDFGLADAQVDAAVSVLTETAPGDDLHSGHVVAGTLHYMAPELLRGQGGDTRTDVWALGVVLHELLSGEHPFVGKTPYELSSAILSSPPRELPATVPPSVRAVVARCLTRDPQRRYQQAREIHAAVDAIRAGGGRAVAKAGLPSRRVLLAGTGTLALGAALVVASQRLFVSPPSLRILAIVPEVQADADPALVDGITESVINRVARLQSSQLRVIALGSVTRYKGRPIDVDQVKRDLGAAYVAILRITPRRDGGLALSAALEDVSVHAHVWGEQYDTRLRSLMEVQDDIAARVAEGLRVNLTGAQRKELARLDTTDGEAYRLYMQGRYYWYRSFATSEGYDKSLSYYQQAIARDPRYALAYLGVADTNMSMTVEGFIPISDALPKVRSALDRALALDPTLPESHYTRGMLAWVTQSDWALAERELRAAAAGAGAPHYRRFYALFLLISARFDEALDEMRRTLEVDPLGVETNTAYGQTLFWTRQHDLAITRLRRAVELDPDFSPAHEILADVYAKAKRYDLAVKELARAARLNGEDAAAADLETRYAKDGFEPAMLHYYRDQLDTFSAVAQLEWVSPMHLAFLSINAGDHDAAFAWLEKARVERHLWLTYLRTDPAFDPLRDDPRFDPLMKKVGGPWAR